MGNTVEILKNSAVEIVSKSVALMGGYIIANNGLPLLMNAAFGHGAADPVQVKLFLLGGAVLIWDKAIVPIVDELFSKLQPKSVAVGTAKKSPLCLL